MSRFLVLLSFFFFVSCQNSSESIKKNIKSEKISSKKNIDQVKRKKVETPKPISVTKYQRKQCHYIFESLMPSLERLLKFRNKKLENANSYFPLSKLSEKSCLDLPIKNLSQLMLNIKTIEKKPIVVVLPLSGEEEERGKNILEGLKSYFQFKNLDFSSLVKVYDTKSSFFLAKEIYSDLVIENNFSILLGGDGHSELQFLNYLSKKFRFPTLVFHHDKFSLNKSSNPYLFEVSQGSYYQAAALAKICSEKGFKKIALMKPVDGHADSLLKDFEYELKKNNITVERSVAYESGNYQSMNQAVMSLYEISKIPSSSSSPESELEENIQKIKNVPKINFDALFIPDDFRILKHFIKIFQFHELPRFKLFGNSQWRFDNINLYWEPFLEGSFFVDTLGQTQNIPPSLTREKDLTSLENLIKVDQTILGYYASKLLVYFLSDKDVKYRHQVARQIHEMSRENLFDVKGSSYRVMKGFQWPSYVFSLEKKSMLLHSIL